MHKKLYSMLLMAMFAALLAIGSYVRIPFPLCPITLQLPFAVLSGLLLGSKRGAGSALCFLAIGLAGVPIFSGGGGLTYVLKPTFGFILAFVGGAFLAGMIAENGEPKLRRLIPAALAGLIVIYAIGTVYYWCISHYYLGSDVGVWAMLVSCVFLPLPKDIVLCIFMALLSRRLLPLIRGMDGKGSKEGSL